MIEVEALVETAARAVKDDMARAPSGAGIWRFDEVLNRIVGPRGRDFLRAVGKLAREKNLGRDTWDREGFGIVAAWAENKVAWMTPGFAQARREHMM